MVLGSKVLLVILTQTNSMILRSRNIKDTIRFNQFKRICIFIKAMRRNLLCGADMSSASGSTSKAVFLSSAKGSPERTRSQPRQRHVRVFSPRAATAGSTPLIIGRAAYIAQSLERPAIIMLAFCFRAKIKGSTPIIPTVSQIFESYLLIKA